MKEIIIKEEFQIPGTNKLVEAGDIIKLVEAGYKSSYEDSKIEITNVDPSYGRLIRDDIMKFIKNRIEGKTHYKVYSVKIDVV